MAAALNNHKEQVAKRLMTEDADFVNVGGTWSKGANRIARSRHERFQTALKNASLRVLDVQIRFIRPDVALVHELHEIVGMLDENGKKLAHREHSLRVFVKSRDNWLVTAFQNTTVAASNQK